MNRNDFLHIMDNSVQVNRQLIGEVYELIDIFPYFQSAHLVLLKGLRNNSDVKFENQLRNSAIQIADREVLYNLLTLKPQTTSLETAAQNENQPVTAIHYDNQQTVIENAKSSEELISEIESTSEAVLVLDEESRADENPVSFIDPGISVPDGDSTDLLELDIDDESKDFTELSTDNKDSSNDDSTVSTRQLQSDLIDKFIISNPRIEPNKEKDTAPIEDISKPFIEMEGGLVTETLARIYINQGYYSKAIDIYEKLSLKFPEKSSYFASQIEKVLEYIKN